MKTEVYSWRVNAGLKTDLEREARRRNLSISAALDRAAREWLLKNCAENDDTEEQRRLHAAAGKCLGAVSGDDPDRSERASELVREKLRRRHGR